MAFIRCLKSLMRCRPERNVLIVILFDSRFFVYFQSWIRIGIVVIDWI
jgi:hypothetical protein